MLHDKRDAVLKVRLSVNEYNRLMVFASTVHKPASFVVRQLIIQLLYEQNSTPTFND